MLIPDNQLKCVPPNLLARGLRAAVFLASTLVLQGCVALKITSDSSEIQGCKMLDYVAASGRTKLEASRALSRRPHALGGNVTFINPDLPEILTPHGPAANLEGRAYSCENKST
jgi:hypothetical protein